MVTRLPQEIALEIYNYIQGSNYSELKEKLVKELKLHAKMRQGMMGKAGAWWGEKIPQEMQNWLNKFGHTYLYSRNVLSASADFMELGVLVGALPNELVNGFFQFDLEESAKEHGISLEDAREIIVNQFLRRENEEKTNYFFLRKKENELFSALSMLGFGVILRNDLNRNEVFVSSGIGERNLLSLLEMQPVFPEKFNFLKEMMS